ncbi:speriolin-like protein isoform X2 [Hoplias malabaricus]|uniref:speriolin-like protein isoform X2 n=1 Tax=Hoplias malabaricus TaxID=27720 RepID=UPI00346252ED
MEQNKDALRVQNETLRREVVDLRHVLNLMKENMELRAGLQSLSMANERAGNSGGADSERLLGEVAFQLDRRILSYVFQNQSRLYGFTVLNIPDKIIQVSTHPLTGKVDEGYRRELTDRYVDLMERLRSLGYHLVLHPPFTEFIINTYGILKQSPDQQTVRELGYDNADLLRRIIIDIAPCRLLKDLLILFSCLCYMARRDRKPLLLW